MRSRTVRSIFLGPIAVLTVMSAGTEAVAAGQREARESALAREVTLNGLLALAVERSPELAAERERSRATQERAEVAGKLPDPQLKYEVWSVPLADPLAFGKAMMHMVGVRQTFPAVGSRSALAEAAQAEADSAGAMVQVKAEEVVARIRRTFAEYQEVEEEYRIRLEHAGLLSRLIEVARASYRTGHGTLQDSLRLEAELARLHVDIAGVVQQRRNVAALLNSLVGRAPETPLGPPAEGRAGEPAGGDEAGVPALPLHRPELAAAAREIDRGQATVQASRRMALYPELMVGVDYMNQPLEHDQHGYGLMVSMSLPWLNPARRAATRSAERSLAAARLDLEAVKLALSYQVTAATERHRAAKEVFGLHDLRLLPTARQSYEVAERSYGAGAGDLTTLLDAWRSYLSARLEHARSAAVVDVAAADLDLAKGTGAAFAGWREAGR